MVYSNEVQALTHTKRRFPRSFSAPWEKNCSYKYLIPLHLKSIDLRNFQKQKRVSGQFFQYCGAKSFWSFPSSLLYGSLKCSHSTGEQCQIWTNFSLLGHFLVQNENFFVKKSKKKHRTLVKGRRNFYKWHRCMHWKFFVEFWKISRTCFQKTFRTSWQCTKLCTKQKNFRKTDFSPR